MAPQKSSVAKHGKPRGSERDPTLDKGRKRNAGETGWQLAAPMSVHQIAQANVVTDRLSRQRRKKKGVDLTMMVSDGDNNTFLLPVVPF